MKRIHLITLSTLLFFLSACTEKVDIDLSGIDPVVVIEGTVSTETDSSFVRVSLTKDYFDEQSVVPVNDAIVLVFSDNDTATFNHTTNGIYVPPAGYKGDTLKQYTLRVLHDGKEYNSTTTLHPMFYVDTNLIFTYAEAAGFLSAGYKVTYLSIDTRPGEIFTQFRFGQNDTLFDQEIFFSSAELVKNALLPFELPFYRPQLGDSVMLVFRSFDPPVAKYFIELGNLRSQAPGPFKTPPANPPTNISGGALGYFLATDIKRVNQVVR